MGANIYLVANNCKLGKKHIFFPTSSKSRSPFFILHFWLSSWYLCFPRPPDHMRHSTDYVLNQHQAQSLKFLTGHRIKAQFPRLGSSFCWAKKKISLIGWAPESQKTLYQIIIPMWNQVSYIHVFCNTVVHWHNAAFCNIFATSQCFCNIFATS